ncbi:MAG: threonine ammonia-lyase [Acidimicrobiales bacterium]
MVSLEEIRRARLVVAPVARRTTLRPSESLSRLAGRRVLLKEEHTQRTGSFKLRGAYNMIRGLADAPSGQNNARSAGVVAASAGNHAQGVALAAQLCGLGATIFMPATASLPKVAATRAYGATVILGGDSVEYCIKAAQEWAERTGAVVVPPFDHPDIIAGQGTLGLEIVEDAPQAQAVVVPVGGGGLVAGVGAALGLSEVATQVVGVEAAGAASMAASLAAGYCVTTPASTMADGIAVASPSKLTLEHTRAYVHHMVTVSEEEISQALVLLVERAKAVVEPAGAVGLAAVLAGKVPGRGPVVVILSGGNVDPLLLVRLIERGLAAAGRYLMLRIVLADRPGALARLTRDLADRRLNVLAVEHHRVGVGLGMDQVEVILTLETLDPDHRVEVVTGLRADGLEIELLN